jgi:hypothetical protein
MAVIEGRPEGTSRQMNDKIKYGDCQPYKGRAIPIRPK